jgi:hypothetical protein
VAGKPEYEKFKKEFRDWYADLDGGGKFVLWWFSFLAVVVVFLVIFFSIVWTPWVAGTALIIVAVLITIGCFIYIEDNY